MADQLHSILAAYGLIIAAGLGLFVCAVIGLLWLVRSGQLDDLETPALRMLHDDEPAGPRHTSPSARPPQEHTHV